MVARTRVRSFQFRVIMRLNFARRSVLILLPVLTLVAGLGVAQLSTGSHRDLRLNEAAALAVAAVGPLTAVLVLSAAKFDFDWILVASAAMLTAIGTATLFSLSLAPGENGAFYQAVVVRHGFFVGAGFLALIAGTLVSHHLDR